MAIFGNNDTTNDDTWVPSNYDIYAKYTSPTEADGGSATSMSWYANYLSAGGIKVALYADSGGEVTGTPLASGSGSVTAGSGKWFTVDFDTPYELVGNTPYWFAMRAENSTYANYLTETTYPAGRDTTTYADFPVDMTGGTATDYTNRHCCVYVTYTPAEEIIEGTTCWGHSTDVEETNTRTFTGNWTGTGEVTGSGDSERIELQSGQYMESEVVNTGAVDIELAINVYSAGSTVTIKYRTSATSTMSGEWNTYSGSFTSLGYVQARVEVA